MILADERAHITEYSTRRLIVVDVIHKQTNKNK